MDNCSLRSVLDLPAPFHSTFNFRYFNSLQSECFSACFLSDMNMVISAPTGSGKTVLFELCILRIFSKFMSTDEKFIPLQGIMKTIYIAPSKALVQEKVRDWNRKFGPLGVSCLELTGDNDNYNIRNIQDADIILTTPEKFDAVTRYRIKDGGLSFFSDIALVLLDEVHLLNDPRGAALEAVVSRIKMLACISQMKSSPLADVRFLAISATIPNIGDLAEWLMVPSQGIKRFGEEMRPVKLTTKVLGYSPAKNDFLFEKRLQNYIFDILMQYSRGRSALVFCSTRKGAQEAAQLLAQTAMTYGHSNPFMKSSKQQERLREASVSCGDKQMQSCILYGVGYHNGGLSQKDRSLIEGLFLNGDLQVLCTTNTLALGINLPAHTVVIKSTQHYNKEKGIYMEYDRSMILQMCGRAGRPPFDDTGTVIIMTRRETVHLYENLLSGCEMVESQLLPCLTEHLTAEIVQLTISDITKAIEWLKCSFLYVRIQRNPENYSVKKGLSGILMEKHMQDICVQKINELSRHQMIWSDEDGFLLKPCEPGVLMTKYYLKFDTMKHIMLAPANCSIEDALHTLCRAEEISWIQLRRNEKKLLNDINMDKEGRLRFHILADKGKKKKRIQTREEKIFILANDCLTGDPLVRDLSMSQDMNSICSNGCRIAKCMKEYFIHKKVYKGTLNSTLLAKSLHQKLWDGSPYLLKQLPGIGMVTAKALHSMGVNSFETLLEADPRKIEIVTGRKYPFGNHIKESLLSLPPKVEIKFGENVCQKQGKSKLDVTLTRLSHTASAKRHYADMIVSIEEENSILFHERIRVNDFLSPYCAIVLIPGTHHGKLTVNADLLFEEFIGIDIHQSMTVGKDIELPANHKWESKSKRPSTRPKDVCTIKDGEDRNDCSHKAPLGTPSSSNESKEPQNDWPSFKLVDDDSEEDVSLPHVDGAPTQDDECKIMTERTVFDHIREKARNLPALALSSDNTCSPSLETLTLIRKRMRERHLEPEDSYEVLDENPKTKVLRPKVVIPYAETINLEPSFDKDPTGTFVGSNADKFLQLPEGPKADTLKEEMIFDHIRRKAKTFPRLDNLKTTALKLPCPEDELYHENKFFLGNFTPEETEPYSRTQFPEDSEIIFSSAPDTMGIGRDSITGGVMDGKGISHRMIISLAKGEELRSVEGLAPRNSSANHHRVNPLTFAEHNHQQPPSPAVMRRQCFSFTSKEDIGEENSFFGFKSIFSFL